MKCENCKAEMVNGHLEGVSFVPDAVKKHFFGTSGIYGIQTTVCPKCGRLGALKVNVAALAKIRPATQTLQNESGDI
jgi:hypothetical protein